MATKKRRNWRWWLWPLTSRKVQVALATVIGAWAAHFGLNADQQTITSIIAVGVALILGIAHEDAGRGGASTK